MADNEKQSINSSDKVEGEKSEAIVPENLPEEKKVQIQAAKKEGRNFDKTFEVRAMLPGQPSAAAACLLTSRCATTRRRKMPPMLSLT
jgi:hypothetical protein